MISVSVPEISSETFREFDDWHQAAALVLARRGRISIQGMTENKTVSQVQL